MRILFALPGLHRVSRGAEIAFMSVASELARNRHDVTLIGSGEKLPDAPYRYLRAPLISRERFERFPKVPLFRGETAWEEATFLPGFLKVYRPQDHDVTLTCSYPFLNWALRARRHRGSRPAHVFVTQNGDWPARSNDREYRFFGCEGLICTNPEYYSANAGRYRAALIPNGVDLERFSPGEASADTFGLPQGKPVVLMVSALIESKMVGLGIEAVSRLEDVQLVVAGDGPLRDTLRAKAEAMMPGRYHNFTIAAEQMPDLYRSANVFLHLSRNESFGNVFVEAMACGVPTVAWDLERTRWITGDTAFLVPESGAESLASQIRTALESDFPTAPLRDRAQQFSWNAVARQYAEFLTEIT